MQKYTPLATEKFLGLRPATSGGPADQARSMSISVAACDIFQAGPVVIASGVSGNSSRTLVTNGIKQLCHAADKQGTWLNPESFFNADDVVSIGCRR